MKTPWLKFAPPLYPVELAALPKPTDPVELARVLSKPLPPVVVAKILDSGEARP